MTSELKCPFCGKPLWRPIGKPTWSCQNWDCLASDNMIGNHTIWEKLIQSQEDLEVARKALEDITKEHSAFADWVFKAVTMKSIAEKALETIGKHKE